MRTLPFGAFSLILMVFGGCQNHVQPRPQGYLSLTFPEPDYVLLKEDVPYYFDYNTIAHSTPSFAKSIKIAYPDMGATIYLNYRRVENNIDSLLYDAYLVPYRHVAKADAIPEKLFTNSTSMVYGQLFSVIGDAASQYQFFLTDSLNPFVIGSLYFYAEPNYDSIYPAVKYIEKDIVRLMESFKLQ